MRSKTLVLLVLVAAYGCAFQATRQLSYSQGLGGLGSPMIEMSAQLFPSISLRQSAKEEYHGQLEQKEGGRLEGTPFKGLDPFNRL
jgi:hypothetical protein